MLLLLHTGFIQESLKLFQQATALNPHKIDNLKQVMPPPQQQQQHPSCHNSTPTNWLWDAPHTLLQVGRSLCLLGKHRAAIDVYDEALKLQDDDAELWLHKGMCAVQLRDHGRCAGMAGVRQLQHPTSCGQQQPVCSRD